MNDSPTLDKTANEIGQKIASGEVSIPLNLPLTGKQPSTATPLDDTPVPEDLAVAPKSDAANMASLPETPSDNPQPAADPAATLPNPSESQPASPVEPEPLPSDLLPPEASDPTNPGDPLSKALHNITPITVKATPEDAEAATKPIVKLIVGIGLVIGILGLIVLFIVGTLAGISTIALGILVVVSAVLSPKPQSKSTS